MLSKSDCANVAAALIYNEKHSEFFTSSQHSFDLGLETLFIEDIGQISLPLSVNEHSKFSTLKTTVIGKPCIVDAKKIHIFSQDNFNQRINHLTKIIIGKMFEVDFDNISVNVQANLKCLVICNPQDTFSRHYLLCTGAFGCMFVSLPMATTVGNGTANVYRGVETESLSYPEDTACFSALGIAATKNISGSEKYSIQAGDAMLAFLTFTLVWTDIFCSEDPPRPVSFPQFIKSAHQASEALRIWQSPHLPLQSTINSTKKPYHLRVVPTASNNYSENVLKAVDSIQVSPSDPGILITPKWLQRDDDLNEISNKLIKDFPEALTQSARGRTIEKNKMLENLQTLLKRASAHPSLSPEECHSSFNVSALLNVCMSLHFDKETADILRIVATRGCLCGSHDWIGLYNQSFGSFASDITKFSRAGSGSHLAPIFILLLSKGTPDLTFQFGISFLQLGHQELTLRIIDLSLRKLKSSNDQNWLETVINLLSKLEPLSDETVKRNSELFKYLLSLPISRLQDLLAGFHAKSIEAPIDKVIKNISIVAMEQDLGDISEHDFVHLSDIFTKHGPGGSVMKLYWTKILNETIGMIFKLRENKPLNGTPLLIRTIGQAKKLKDRSFIILAIAKSGMAQELTDALIQCLLSIRLSGQIDFSPVAFTHLFLVVCHIEESVSEADSRVDMILSGLNEFGACELWNLILGVDIKFDFEKYPKTKKIYEHLLFEIGERDVLEVVKSSGERFGELFERICLSSNEETVDKLIENIGHAQQTTRDTESQQLLCNAVTSILNNQSMLQNEDLENKLPVKVSSKIRCLNNLSAQTKPSEETESSNNKNVDSSDEAGPPELISLPSLADCFNVPCTSSSPDSSEPPLKRFKTEHDEITLYMDM